VRHIRRNGFRHHMAYPNVQASAPRTARLSAGTNPSRAGRDREHVRSVIKQPCLICGRTPSDPHHLRFTQSRALGRRSAMSLLCRSPVHARSARIGASQFVGVSNNVRPTNLVVERVEAEGGLSRRIAALC
jgi:hypothetical protein